MADVIRSKRRFLRHHWGSIKLLFARHVAAEDLKGRSPMYIRLLEVTQICMTTIRSYSENIMGLQCVALSYFVLMSLIPFCAFIFAITGGLGLSDKLADVLMSAFPTYPDLINLIMDKAGNIISIAESGGVGLISALIFLWAVLWMMFQVERVFNHVWGIRNIPRNIFKRFGFYFLVMFLSPFVMILFGTGIAYYTNLPNLIGIDISELRFLGKLLGYALFYTIIVFTLSVMYKFIPATNVRYKYALKSALVTGVFFLCFQYIYLETQVFVGRLNAAYGVIAAVPLFLMWLNFSWQIIIFGAELTFGFHHVQSLLFRERWAGDRLNTETADLV